MSVGSASPTSLEPDRDGSPAPPGPRTSPSASGRVAPRSLLLLNVWDTRLPAPTDWHGLGAGGHLPGAPPPRTAARCPRRPATTGCRGRPGRCRSPRSGPHGPGGEDLTGPAAAITRAAMCTAMPPTSPSRPPRHVQPHPELDADAAQLVSRAAAQRIPRPGPSKVASSPSPVVLTSRPPNSSTSRRASSSWVFSSSASAGPQPAGALGGGDDVGEQHRGQHPGRLGGPTDAGQELLDQVQGEPGVSQTSVASAPGSSTSLASGMCSAR